MACHVLTHGVVLQNRILNLLLDVSMVRMKIDMDVSSCAAKVVNVTSWSENCLGSRIGIYASGCINHIGILSPFLNCLGKSRLWHSRRC